MLFGSVGKKTLVWLFRLSGGCQGRAERGSAPAPGSTAPGLRRPPEGAGPCFKGARAWAGWAADSGGSDQPLLGGSCRAAGPRPGARGDTYWMRDTRLDQQIPGLRSPWRVTPGDPDRPGDEVRVHGRPGDETLCWPTGGEACPGYAPRATTSVSVAGVLGRRARIARDGGPPGPPGPRGPGAMRRSRGNAEGGALGRAGQPLHGVV
jgi:hypothetical protein